VHILVGIVVVSLPHVAATFHGLTIPCMLLFHYYVLPVLLQAPLLKVGRLIALTNLERAKAELVGGTPLAPLRRSKSEYAEGEFKLLATKNGLSIGSHHLWAFVPLVLTWLGYALLWIFALRCLSWVGINSLLVMGHNLVLSLVLLVPTLRGLGDIEDVFSLRFELCLLCTCSLLLFLAQLWAFSWLVWAEPNIAFIWNSVYHVVVLSCLASMAIATLSVPVLCMPRAPTPERPGGAASKQLRSLLAHPTGVAHLKAFLQANFLSEYYLFWRDVEEFRTLKPGTDLMTEAAKWINGAYVRAGAALDVRLDYVQQLQVGHAIGSGVRPTMFDSVQETIFSRMCQLFPLFLDSIFAAECSDKLQDGLPTTPRTEFRDGFDGSMLLEKESL